MKNTNFKKLTKNKMFIVFLFALLAVALILEVDAVKISKSKDEAEEIKKVFSLAFNEINDRNDDIISWETAYKIFVEIQKESYDSFLSNPIGDEEKLDEIMRNFELQEKDEDRIRVFILVISLIAQASVIKKLVQKIATEYDAE